jgi:hypothetical protein
MMHLETYNITRDTFVFDSGATSHMGFSKDGMVNLKPLKIAINQSWKCRGCIFRGNWNF